MDVEADSTNNLNEDININYKLPDHPVRSYHDEYLSNILDEIIIRSYVLGIDVRTILREHEERTGNLGYIHLNTLYEAFRKLGIRISQSDYSLLLRRYQVHGMFLHCQSLLEDLTTAMWRVQQKKPSDFHPLLLMDEISSKNMKVPFPKLKRPDEKVLYPKEYFKCQDTSHPAVNRWPHREGLYDAMTRIQRYCYTNRIRPEEFFKGFDKSNSGKILKAQFLSALDTMGASSTGPHTRLHLSQDELNDIVDLYKSSKVPEYVLWQKFIDDLNDVYAPKDILKRPLDTLDEYDPTVNVRELHGRFAGHVLFTKLELLQLEEAISWIKERLKENHAQLLPFFKSFDKYNLGFVSPVQFRQAMSMVNVPLSNDHGWIIVKFFTEKNGFQYRKFLAEVGQEDDFRPCASPQVKEEKPETSEVTKERKFDPVLETESKTLEGVLLKIKHTVFERRLRLGYFFEQYDHFRREIIDRTTFMQAMSSAFIFPLSLREYDILMDAFSDPFNKDIVFYKQFLRTVNEVDFLEGLERAPLLIPLPYMANLSVRRTPYTLAENKVIDNIWAKIGKLCSYNDWDVFMDMKNMPQARNTTTLTRLSFMKVMDRLKVRELLSTYELDLLFESFGVMRGREVRFDWQAFLTSAEMLNRKVHNQY